MSHRAVQPPLESAKTRGDAAARTLLPGRREVSRVRRLVQRCLAGFAMALATALPAASRLVAQSDSAANPACIRIAFGAWNPPLDWARAGHQDSAARISAAVRRARDSVFASSQGVGAREAMHWADVEGERRLFLYPPWWPAGIMIRFTSPALGDTLLGEGQAMVADLGSPISRARARVVTRCNPSD